MFDSVKWKNNMYIVIMNPGRWKFSVDTQYGNQIEKPVRKYETQELRDWNHTKMNKHKTMTKSEL